MSQQKTPHKIIFYTDTPLYGGAEKQMYLLAKHLDKKMFQPIFIFRKLETLKELSEDLAEIGINAYLIPSKSKHSLQNLTYLNKIINQEKPALIHAHIWNPMAGKYAFLSRIQKKIPLIITEHDPFKLSFPKSLYKKISLNFADKIIAVSSSNTELLKELYPAQSTKISTIHNGIETHLKPISEIDLQKIRKNVFQAGPETKVIISVGTLHTRKGFKYLISAYKKVLQKNPNSKLIIVGEGPERENLEKLIKNLSLGKRIMLLGQRSDVSELLQAANLFVLPSIKEAFGLVILESWRAGLPVIASAVGGIPEIITENSGIMIEAGNKNELIKAINKVLSNDKLAKDLSKNGKQQLLKFSAEKTAGETAKIYLELINPVK